MTTTNEHTERAELIGFLRAQADQTYYEGERDMLTRAAAMLEAQPAEQSKGQDVAKFFLPPALHEGIAENTAGTYRLRVTGLTIRQIKDVFEDKFLGSMMWSGGAAYPTDGVEIRFIRPQPQAAQPAERVALTDEQKSDLWKKWSMSPCEDDWHSKGETLRLKDAFLAGIAIGETIGITAKDQS